MQDCVLQKDVEDVAMHERLWLLVNSFSLQAELLEEAYAGVSGGHLRRRKALCSGSVSSSCNSRSHLPKGNSGNALG